MLQRLDFWLAVLTIGFLAWLEGRNIVARIRSARVNHSAKSAPVVMSRSSESEHHISPSSLQTDSRQTTDSAARALPSRDVMLDTYRLLRKHGMAREEARPMLKALGLPLDNNLWTEAAPPSKDDDVLITPYAGRATKRSFYPDEPELEYQAPRG
jgi:hypothetical protein